MRRFLFGLVGLLVFSPIACAGSPQKSSPPFQRLVADLGPGCRFAVTLLGRKGVVSPQDSSRTEVGGDPKVGKGGMVEAPYPKPWKGIMNSLEVIAKRNAEAIERDIPRQQRRGKYVVAEYHGLHFVGFETFDDERSANEKAAKIGKHPGRIAKVFNPIVTPESKA